MSDSPMIPSANGSPSKQPSREATLDELGPPNQTRASDLDASGIPGRHADTVNVPPNSAPPSQRYVLSAFHARGGMGEIWRCRDVTLGREVALKRLASDRKTARERFLSEAQIAGQLQHPGIVPVHDFGLDEEGKPYYVMSFIRGRTLEAAISEFHSTPTNSDGPREPRAVIRIRLLEVFIDLCQAVAYAHSRGVIHRDLKPANVMLGPFGETIVLDWGLAKLNGQPDLPPQDAGSMHPALSGRGSQTEAGSVLGSPLYMPPEMASGHASEADQRSDVYLLGATLYEILAGRPPRSGPDVDHLLELARSGSPVSPRSLVRDTPRAVEAICLKAMARSPAHRYQSAIELAEDIQRFLAGEAVTAYREPLPQRAWRWARQHRRALSRSAVSVIVLAALSAAAILYRVAAASRAREQSRAVIRRVQYLCDEARYSAAGIDAPSEQTPYFDPATGERHAQEAIALAAPWGAQLAQLPLPDEREALRRELADVCLLVAQNASATHTHSSDWLDRAKAFGDGAAPAQPSAGDTHDLFLQAERLRLQSAREDLPLLASDAAANRRRRIDTLSRAAASYQQAIRQRPADYWSHLQLGRCYLAIGRGPEAIEALGTAVALRPDAPWAYSTRGLALALLKRFDEAEQDLKRAIDLDPDGVAPRINQGSVLLLRGQRSRAAEVFDELLSRRDPPLEAAFYGAQLRLADDNPAGALALLDRLLADHPQSLPARLLRVKALLIRNTDADHAAALNDLDRIVVAQPAPAAASRGRLLRLIAAELPRQSQLTALHLAEVDLVAATSSNGAASSAFADLGAVLHLQGRFSPAIAAYEQAIVRAPADVQTLVDSGWTLDALNRLSDAKARFEQALTVDHDNPEALTGRGYVNAQLARAGDAQADAAMAILHGSGDYRILHNVACIYAQLSVNDSPRAAAHEDAAIALLHQAIANYAVGWSAADEKELIRNEPAFSNHLRQRPEFRSLLENQP